MDSCGCWSGLRRFGVGSRHANERDEFEKVISFLGSVPLFRSQLPRSLLPKVADNLSWQAWKPGQKLVEQGEIGKAFFLIHSGEASVLSFSSAGAAATLRATLGPGDHFGGHTLVTERLNVATVVARKGPTNLVTLSMSRCAFEQLGLHRQLKFAKRPAFHLGSANTAERVAADLGIQGSCWEQCWHAVRPRRPAVDARKSDEELNFIRTAINSNSNFRALMQASEDMLRSIAASAERRTVVAGEVVADCGEFGQEFFIVREGTFEVTCEDAAGQQSVESVVARSTMAQRLVRKQKFLQTLSRRPAKSLKRRRSHDGSSVHENFPRANDEEEKSGFYIEADSNASSMDNCHAWFQQKEASGLSLTSTVSGSSLDDVAHLDLACRQEATKRDVQDLHGPDAHLPASAHCPPGDELVGVFGPGESFGELSLLYNTKREATFRAREDGVLYVIGQRHIAAHCSRMTQRFQEYCKLLDEVHALASLLRSERWELASSALGFVSFPAGERVMTQGKERQAKLWYVVASGCAVLKLQRPGEEEAVVGHLARGGQFGERTLLRNETACDISVDAGEDGMSCLTFDGKVVREILEKIFKTADDCLPSLEGDAAEWCGGWAEMNARGWKSSMEFNRQSSQELEICRLEEVCILGNGSFSTVILVRVKGRSRHERQYALKRISKALLQKHDMFDQVNREREILLMLDSAFVARLHRTYKDDYFLYFLLEACLGGNLLEAAKSHAHVFADLRGAAMGFYVACIIAGLEHMHERRIAYRDLKPENVFLSNKGYGKLGDMGFARFVLGKTNTIVGTPDYMAPEILSSPHSHDHCVDWWALGVVVFEIISGRMPFQCSDVSDPKARMMAVRDAQDERLKFGFGFPRAAQSFVEQLLQELPQRLGTSSGANELRQHEWFSVLRFDFKALGKQTLKAPISIDRKPNCQGLDMGRRPVSRKAEIDMEFVDDGSGWDKEF